MPIRTLLSAILLFFLTSSWVLAQGTATETLDFELEIEPVFRVETDADAGSSVRLNLSSEKDSVQTTRVSVSSNRELPYRIIQKLEGTPMSDQGAEFPLDQIRLSASAGTQGGRSEISSPTPLSLQPMTLFSSNSKGESDQFTIHYEISGDHLIPAGTYRARLLIEEQLG